MRFGVLLDHQYARDDDLQRCIPRLVDLVETVRDLGFDSVFGIHHYLSNLRTLQPLPLLARLIPHTGSMQVGTGIYIVPLSHPVQLAEEVATLDQLSGGRFVLGAGAGYRAEEFAAFGIPRKERSTRLVESLDVMRQLWSGEPVNHDGAHYHLDGATLSVLPVQPGGPPIWIGANSAEAIERAGRLGYAWLASGNVKRNWAVGNLAGHREALLAAGHDPAACESPIHRDLCIADSREEAFRIAEPYVRASYAEYVGYGLEYFDSMFEEFKEKSFFFGTPDEVAARIEDFAAGGFDHFVFRVQWLGCPEHVSRTILERFAAEVMPRFRPAAAA